MLGLDLKNESKMKSIWPYVSNPEAIAINQLWVGDPGRFLVNRTKMASADNNNNKVEVWAKLQPNGKVAVLAINTDDMLSHSVDIKVSELWPGSASIFTPSEPLEWCTTTPCDVRDVWKRQHAGKTHGGVWHVSALSPHDSSFMIITPHGNQ